jgi:hypothetical protein
LLGSFISSLSCLFWLGWSLPSEACSLNLLTLEPIVWVCTSCGWSRDVRGLVAVGDVADMEAWMMGGGEAEMGLIESMITLVTC